MADASILMMKPMTPTAPKPMKHIFIDSQSSLFPGFTASFNVLAHCDRNDLKPMSLPELNTLNLI
jgi:hypothetical protein